jgi:hypothetical protein
MGFMDRVKGLRKKAEAGTADHKDQIHSAVEKAEAAADQRTGGQYHDQIQKAGGKIDELTDRLASEGAQGDAPQGDRPSGPPPAGPPPAQGPPST